MHPLTILHISFTATSTVFGRADRSQLGISYFSREKQKASAFDRNMLGFASYFDDSNFRRTLFQLPTTFCFVSSHCFLKVKVRSRAKEVLEPTRGYADPAPEMPSVYAE